MHSVFLFSAGLPVSVPLADSGYRSYRIFSVAFKQRTGQSVKDWIAEQESAL